MVVIRMRWILGILAGSIVLATVAGCGGQASSSSATGSPRGGVTDAPPSITSPSKAGDPSPSSGRTYFLQGYDLDRGPQAAIDFTGNDEIFEARVIGKPQDSVTIEPDANSGAPMIVYLPVPLTITKVYKGSLEAGDMVTVRDLGGQASDGTKVINPDGIEDATWQPGTQLFVFSNRPVQPPNDELQAMTPNMVFVEDSGRVRSAYPGSKDQIMSLSLMRGKVQARWSK